MFTGQYGSWIGWGEILYLNYGDTSEETVKNLLLIFTFDLLKPIENA